jgi:hypothetical protein
MPESRQHRHLLLLDGAVMRRAACEAKARECEAVALKEAKAARGLLDMYRRLDMPRGAVTSLELAQRALGTSNLNMANAAWWRRVGAMPLDARKAKIQSIRSENDAKG